MGRSELKIRLVVLSRLRELPKATRKVKDTQDDTNRGVESSTDVVKT